jgi:hypothetical protein
MYDVGMHVIVNAFTFVGALACVHVQEIERNTETREKQGERKVPLEVIMKMKKKFVLPDDSEGFDEV